MTTFPRARLLLFPLVAGMILCGRGTAGADRAGAAALARPDVVLRWNDALLRYTASTGSVQPSSGATALLLALMHGAMREAVEAAMAENATAADDAVPAAAAAAAAHGVLSPLVPAQRGAWDRVLAEFLTASDETARARAMALGSRVAKSWLETRGYDGAAAAANLAWSEPVPGWTHSARPFVLKRADQYRAATPDLNAVIGDRIHGSQCWTSPESRPSGDADRRADRLIWAASAEDLWNRVARHLIRDRPMDLRERANLFWVLNAAMVDGYLAAYESREHYRKGCWYFLLGAAAEAFGATNSPPEVRVSARVENYPNVPAVISGAAMEILQSCCGGDEQRLVIASPLEPSSPPRTYACISAAAKAFALAGESTDRDEFEAGPAGFQQGRKIGRWIAGRAASR